MRKLRLYLDTSVISNVDAPHVPDKEETTRKFFQVVKESPEDYELFISPMVIAEIEKSPEPKLSKFLAFLKRIKPTKIPKSDEALDLADIYLKEGVLSERHTQDLQHAAYAVVARCDFIVSWNFKHLVTARTISRINAVNEAYNYHSIIIASPLVITGDSNHEEN